MRRILLGSAVFSLMMSAVQAWAGPVEVASLLNGLEGYWQGRGVIEESIAGNQTRDSYSLQLRIRQDGADSWWVTSELRAESGRYEESSTRLSIIGGYLVAGQFGSQEPVVVEQSNATRLIYSVSRRDALTWQQTVERRKLEKCGEALCLAREIAVNGVTLFRDSARLRSW